MMTNDLFKRKYFRTHVDLIGDGSRKAESIFHATPFDERHVVRREDRGA